MTCNVTEMWIIIRLFVTCQTRYIKVDKGMKGLEISERNCYLLINCRIGLSPSK